MLLLLCGYAGQESQGYQPEELNKKALEITQRVKQKLTGIIVHLARSFRQEENVVTGEIV